MTIQPSTSGSPVASPTRTPKREMSARIGIGLLLATLLGCMIFVFWVGLTRY